MSYDVAVIGTGPAGLSAAITLKIRNKDIILFGNTHLSDKIGKAHLIRNYPGLPDVSGKELAKSLKRHIDSLGIQITEELVSAVYAMGEMFSIQTTSNHIYEAKSVILATGVSFEKPFPGEEEFLGRGVSYCATCDALLYRDKTVAIIGTSPKEETEADFMAEIAKKVYYIPLYPEEVSLNKDIVVRKEKPVSISGSIKVDKLVFENDELPVDGVFILRDNVFPQSLVPGIAVDGKHISVNRNMETNLKGCFACGDCTGTPYQYIKAAGEGNVAALSAVSYLNDTRQNRKEEFLWNKLNSMN